MSAAATIKINDTNFGDYKEYAKEFYNFITAISDSSKLNVDGLKQTFNKNVQALKDRVNPLKNKVDSETSVENLIKAYIGEYREVVLAIVKYLIEKSQKDAASTVEKEAASFKALIVELQSIISGVVGTTSTSKKT